MKLTTNYILSELELKNKFRTTLNKKELEYLINSLSIEARLINPEIYSKIYFSNEPVDNLDRIKLSNRRKFSVDIILHNREKILFFIR